VATESFDGFPGPVILFDTDGKLHYANAKARTKLGAPPIVLLEPEMSISGPELVTLKLRRRSGKVLELPCLAMPYKDRVLAIAYTQAQSRVQELQMFKDALARFLVHDLNTMLTGVLGSVQLLRMDDNTNLSEGQQKLVENAYRSGQELRKMIQNILDVTQMEGTRLQIKPESVPVATLFQRVMDDYQSAAIMMGKRIRVRLTDPSLMVNADLDMILRVISNLLANALKYAPRKGEIVLEGDITDEGWVWIAVSDTGPGIAREYQQKVFEKYFQIQNSRRQAGAGIGLAFCKLAVEAHGGHIWVESEPGEGARFKFTLPAA
jgi:signal transduction histidine kinase